MNSQEDGNQIVSPTTPSIAVGIVIFNTPIELVRRTLAHLTASDVPIEIYALCNSPSLSYQKAVAVLCNELGAMAILNQPNQGFGAGHNAIVALITSEWYVCCNPDIEVRSDTIRRLVEASGKASDAIILGPRILGQDGEVQPLARRHITLGRWLARQLWRLAPKHSHPFEITFDYSQTQPIDFVSGAFFCIRTAIFRQLQGFDEKFFLYCEDADLSRRAGSLGHNYYVADAVVVHAWEMAWTKSWQAARWQLKSLRMYFKKHGWFIWGG